jgi:hypothetical protein
LIPIKSIFIQVKTTFIHVEGSEEWVFLSQYEYTGQSEIIENSLTYNTYIIKNNIRILYETKKYTLELRKGYLFGEYVVTIPFKCPHCLTLRENHMMHSTFNKLVNYLLENKIMSLARFERLREIYNSQLPFMNKK